MPSFAYVIVGSLLYNKKPLETTVAVIQWYVNKIKINYIEN